MEVFGILILGVIAYFVFKPVLDGWNEKDREIAGVRQAEKRAALAKKEQARQALEAAHRHAGQLNKAARDRLGALAGLVFEAEHHLDAAETEFEERAYGPFWSEVEAATIALARYDESLREIAAATDEYSKLASGRADLPALDLSGHTIPDTSQQVGRLTAVARAGQKDYEFATIYEQRKTNQLLIAGFTSLDSSVRSMGQQIESSLDRLSDSLSDAIEAQTDQLTRAHAADAQVVASRIDEQTALTARTMADQTRALSEEMGRARQVAERESRARVRKDLEAGDFLAR